MKKLEKPVLKKKTLNRFQGQIWEKPEKKTGPDPITTSGVICTYVGER